MAKARSVTLAAAATLLLAGCGVDETESGDTDRLAPTGGGGLLVYALPSLPASLDPLAARSLDAQVITRQIHEPLVSTVAGPYGGPRKQTGLALSLKPSAEGTVWTVQLRPGVVFQDSTPFNADAVLVNSRRWASIPAGRALLPDLFAVDAPRPGEVRFLLERPVPDLPRILADPRLGIVSPLALAPHSGGGSRFRNEVPSGSGTGPFELSKQEGSRLDLVRNPTWWASPLGFGPAIDLVAFEAVPARQARLELLRSGEAQIAGPFPPAILGSLPADPLLSAVPRTGGGIGTEASVRGLHPADPIPLLSGAWLTTLPD